MIKTLVLTVGVVICSSCSSIEKPTSLATGRPERNNEHMTVRVTTYWKNGKGTDKWSKKGISASGVPLVNKISAAVDPKIIPFGSRISIPDLKLNLVAVDTGSAVKNRTASRKNGRNEPIIDLFFYSKYDALNFCKYNKDYLVTRAFIY